MTPKHHTPFSLLIVVLSLVLLTACEKATTGSGDDPETPKTQPGQALVSLRIAPAPTTTEAFGVQQRSVRPVQDVSSRISVAFFQGGERKTLLTQDRSTDTNFGSPTIAIDKGRYQLVVIAHNGDGNVTLTNPAEVKFPDNKTTDTFYYCDSINVVDDTSISITLQRAVAMFRLEVNDPVPADVTTMKFYYTGGSSTLDATTGYGCVNSRQTELFTVTGASHASSSTYEVYTFPHADGKKLKMTVSALSAEGTTLYEAKYDSIEVKRGQITRCQVDFFEVNAASKGNYSITVDDTWTTATYEP